MAEKRPNPSSEESDGKRHSPTPQQLLAAIFAQNAAGAPPQDTAAAARDLPERGPESFTSADGLATAVLALWCECHQGRLRQESWHAHQLELLEQLRWAQLRANALLTSHLTIIAYADGLRQKLVEAARREEEHAGVLARAALREKTLVNELADAERRIEELENELTDADVRYAALMDEVKILREHLDKHDKL